MERDKMMRVTIGAIDEDGGYRHVFVGMSDRRRVQQIMSDILAEDGLPVLDVHSKHDRFGDVIQGGGIAEAVKRAAAASCAKSSRLSPEQAGQLIDAVKRPDGGLVAHAYFRVGDVIHNVTGPASWVREQIEWAEKAKIRAEAEKVGGG